ncbi:MAG TPA: helix-turn-helix domain-containing protein [Candidatus Cybelea sp.]
MTTNNQGPQISKVLSINEAAEVLRVSRSTLKRLIGEEKLRTIRLGRRVLVPVSSIDELLERGAA